MASSELPEKGPMSPFHSGDGYVEVPPHKVHLNPNEQQDPYPMFSDRPVPPKKPGQVRIWVDGCFDMLHFGHANALRQALRLGDELFVGTHSDEEIIRFKGPPIMKAEERYEALRACKWVTYVVENYPYVTRLKDMQRFEIDYVVHGDDVSVDLNGRNSYQEIIDAGKFKVVKRTDGISTTDLVGRMLLCTKNHLISSVDQMKLEEELVGGTPLHYLTTSRKIAQFSNNSSPKAGDRIVYVPGSFDLFHIGHIKVLQEARKLGDYVIAGIHEDSVINKAKSNNYPIMNLNERVLGVLSCRYVDEVVMGVPYEVTKEVIDTLNVSFVVGGKTHDEVIAGSVKNPWAAAQALGIYREVDSGCLLTTDGLIDRVLKNRAAFLERQAEKRKKDKSGIDNKPSEYRNIKEVE